MKQGLMSTDENIAKKGQYTFPCCIYETPRTFEWCEKNCARYYSCDTVAMYLDIEKEEDELTYEN